MALKTFNVDEKAYKKFSYYCKEHGISMSKQIDLFITYFLAEGSEAKELFEKMERIKKL